MVGVLLLAFGAGAFLGYLAAERDKDRNLLVAHRLHRLLASHRLFDIGRELLPLALFPRDFALPKFRHDFLCEQFKRLANVLVLVAAALLNEHGLVDARLLEWAQMSSQLIRRADAVIGAGRRQCMPRLLEIGPDIGASRLVFAEDAMMPQAVPKHT